MGEKPSQRVLLWSQLDMWHDNTTTLDLVEGRYVDNGILGEATCRLCGCLVNRNYLASHDAYHEEQGY